MSETRRIASVTSVSLRLGQKFATPGARVNCEAVGGGNFTVDLEPEQIKALIKTGIPAGTRAEKSSRQKFFRIPLGKEEAGW